MYCGAELGVAVAPEQDPVAPLGADELRAKAERARGLLASLKPEARAMMPPEVLAKLEADAEAGGGPACPPPAPEKPRLVLSQRGPRRSGAAPRRQRTPEPPDELPLASFESLDELPSANQEDGEGSFEATLLEALGRGGGPFGPRKAAWRLVMLPDPSYRASLPWLRPRLASTVGIDSYTALQYLQRPVPSYLGSAEQPDELSAQADHLASAGLRVLVLPRRDWARDRLPRLVRDVDPDADPLVFEMHEGPSICVDPGTLSWAATAEIQPVRERGGGASVTRSRWGMPVAPDRLGLADRFTPYFALDLCRSDDPRPPRIRSSTFDFERLGAERAIAAAVNIRHLATRLGRGGQLPLDTGFRKVPSLPGPEEREAGGQMKAGSLPRREVDFTEYVLLLDARYQAGRGGRSG